MTLSRLTLILLLLCAHWISARAAEVGDEMDDLKLKHAITLLQQTESGAKELKEAEAMKIPISAGSVSKTDITATRTGRDTNESFQFITKVTISEEKEPVFQALDLAHELIHATHPKSNPFDPNLNAESYIRHGIEGEGGEADAIAQECAVGKELSEMPSAKLSDENLKQIQIRCQFVWDTAQDQAAWKKSFYFLGKHYREFMKSVATLNLSPAEKNNWAEHVEAKNPVFSSAVAHKPYPLALLEEYVAITHKVCDRAKANKLARNIAAISLLKDRCSAVGTELIE